MRPQIKITMIVFQRAFVLALLALSASVSAQDKTVKISVGEWPPFISQNLKHYGVAAHLVKEAFANEGYTVEYGFFPWKRSMILAESGEWNGSMPWGMKQKRQEKFHYTAPLMKQVITLLHHKDLDVQWDTLKDLKEHRFGATRGYFYGKEFEEHEKSELLKVRRTTSDIQNLKKLRVNRIDIFIVEKNVGVDLINKTFTPEEKSQFIFHPKSIDSSGLYLLLSKNTTNGADLTKTFNQGLKKLKSSGRYDQFINDSLNQKYQ